MQLLPVESTGAPDASIMTDNTEAAGKASKTLQDRLSAWVQGELAIVTKERLDAELQRMLRTKPTVSATMSPTALHSPTSLQSPRLKLAGFGRSARAWEYEALDRLDECLRACHRCV